MLRALRGLHGSTQYVVYLQAQPGRRYHPTRGLREGCPSNPILFNSFHEEAAKQAERARKELADKNDLEDGVK